MKTTNTTTTVQAQPETFIKYKGKLIRRLGNYEGEPRIYRIIRFRSRFSPLTPKEPRTMNYSLFRIGFVWIEIAPMSTGISFGIGNRTLFAQRKP